MNIIRCHGFLFGSFYYFAFWYLLSLNVSFIKGISLQNIRFPFHYKIGCVCALYIAESVRLGRAVTIVTALPNRQAKTAEQR